MLMVIVKGPFIEHQLCQMLEKQYTYNNTSSTNRQWAITHIAMSSDPANICCTPEDVTLMVIEDIFECSRSI